MSIFPSDRQNQYLSNSLTFDFLCFVCHEGKIEQRNERNGRTIAA